MKKIINFYKRLSFFQGVAFAIALTSIIGFATTVGPLTTFTPGTTISSSQINTNFTNLKTAVESISASQTYMGTHDASGGGNPSGATAAGEYFIITVSGTIGGVTYNPGDWMMFNNGSTFDKVPGTSTSIFGRTGVVIATEGDYNLEKLSDVTVASPSTGQILSFNGSQWTNTAVTYTEADPLTMAFAKTSLPTCSGGQFLQANGSSFSCAYPISLTANKVLLTDGSGQATTSAVTNTEVGYLTGVTSSVQTQLDSKESMISAGTVSQYLRGDKTWQQFESSVLSSILTGLSATDAVITSADTVVSAFGKTQGQLNNKISNTGGSITSGILSISGAASLTVPSPVTSSEAANKGYIDSFGQWLKTGSDIYFQGGNVGIGTSTPAYMLHVAGSSFVDGNLTATKYLTNTGGSSSTPSYSSSTAPSSGLFFPSSNMIGFSTAGVERIRIDSTGYTGIGTTSPAYTLHVNGTVAGTSAYANISDVRFKKDIKRVPNALEKLLSIEGVSYKFRTNEFPDLKLSNRREIGVIAQDVENVFPEAVSSDSKGFKSVAYTMLISPIIEALRSLDSKTKNLEEENKMLKNYLCTRDPMAPFCEE